MFSLIWKDLLLSRKMLPLILAYGIFMIIVFDNSMNVGSVAFVASIVAVTYLMVTRAAAYDEVDKAEVLLLSLPLSRTKVVVAKYLSVLLYTLIGIVSYFLGMFILKIAQIPLNITPVTVESFLGMFVALTFLSTLYFPLYFKMGYMKARMINIFLFLAAFFLPSFLISALQEGLFPGLNKFANVLQSQSNLTTAVIILSLCVLALGGSFFLSLFFYKRREF